MRRCWNTWRPALELGEAEATTTRHARDFLSRGRARGFAGAAPESRGPARPRVSRWPLTYDRARRPHPRVKGTRLLGAGDVREKGRRS